MKTRKKFSHKILKRLTANFLIFLAALIVILVNYKNKTFGNISVDSLFFYLLSGQDGANLGTFFKSVMENVLPFLAVFGILLIPTIDFYRDRILVDIDFTTKKKTYKFQINPTKEKQRHLLLYGIIVFIAASAYGLNSLDMYDYVMAKTTSSNFFEENYVDPSKAKITFPDKKRNLIYIYLESTETTILSSKNGGSSATSLSPELENLALNNISFSNTLSLGGALPVYGTTWTVAGMVAQSAGIPIATEFAGNELGNYFTNFLPGAHSLGEVLEKEGYSQEIMFGSDASFAGRDKYFTQHGNYKIFDYYTAIKDGKIPSDYHTWWGYEDNKLIDYAKEEITKLSDSSQPFNFQMLTADTHFVDGYLDPTCATEFDSQYKNVFACASKRIGDFVDWIKQQDFYNNTTIVISGDHLGMQTDFYDDLIGDTSSYQRAIYNTIINAAIAPVKEKQRRFTTLDFYPTTLASIGAKINGDSLGLGVNLFSDKQTLVEKYGLEYMNTELQKKSSYYSNNILYSK